MKMNCLWLMFVFHEWYDARNRIELNWFRRRFCSKIYCRKEFITRHSSFHFYFIIVNHRFIINSSSVPVSNAIAIVHSTKNSCFFTHTPHHYSLIRRCEDYMNVNATQTTCFSTCKSPDGFSRPQCVSPIITDASKHYVLSVRTV